MAENNLKRIADAIPVTSAGSVSTQAHNILLGLTGEDVEFDIAGEQPTLFAAPLTGTINKVHVGDTATANLNGGFAALTSVKATIDGVEVQLLNNDYFIQSSDDGKTLVIELSASGFKKGISQISLTYTDISGFTSVTLDLISVLWKDTAIGYYIDTHSVSSYYHQYLCGDADMSQSVYSDRIMPLATLSATNIVVSQSLPIIGLIANHDFTIDSGSSLFNPTSVIYPIGMFFYKTCSGYKSWYEERFNQVLRTGDLPSGTNTGSSATAAASFTVTNLRSLDSYTITKSSFYTALNNQLHTWGVSGASASADAYMECLAGDKIRVDATFSFYIQ